MVRVLDAPVAEGAEAQLNHRPVVKDLDGNVRVLDIVLKIRVYSSFYMLTCTNSTPL